MHEKYVFFVKSTGIMILVFSPKFTAHCNNFLDPPLCDKAISWSWSWCYPGWWEKNQGCVSTNSRRLDQIKVLDVWDDGQRRWKGTKDMHIVHGWYNLHHAVQWTLYREFLNRWWSKVTIWLWLAMKKSRGGFRLNWARAQSGSPVINRSRGRDVVTLLRYWYQVIFIVIIDITVIIISTVIVSTINITTNLSVG